MEIKRQLPHKITTKSVHLHPHTIQVLSRKDKHISNKGEKGHESRSLSLRPNINLVLWGYDMSFLDPIQIHRYVFNLLPPLYPFMSIAASSYIFFIHICLFLSICRLHTFTICPIIVFCTLFFHFILLLSLVLISLLFPLSCQ